MKVSTLDFLTDTFLHHYSGPSIFLKLGALSFTLTHMMSFNCQAYQMHFIYFCYLTV